ncbi:MAG: hypothetical protein QGD94_10210, partial [Planctomycetia bacterium]|nr:hypothetical protein [Planctomycetia bacterium]
DARRGGVVVLSPAGRARVVARDGQYAYLPGSGDPLKLAEIIRKMRTARKLDADGFASPGDWFDATWDHYYPHAVVNVWRAFGELVDNSPDVILSLKPGYYFGKTGFSSIARIRSTHGSLRRRETTAFYMTTEYETDEPLYLTDFSADVAKRTGRQSPFDISGLPRDYGKSTQEKQPRN